MLHSNQVFSSNITFEQSKGDHLAERSHMFKTNQTLIFDCDRNWKKLFKLYLMRFTKFSEIKMNKILHCHRSYARVVYLPACSTLFRVSAKPVLFFQTIRMLPNCHSQGAHQQERRSCKQVRFKAGIENVTSSIN